MLPPGGVNLTAFESRLNDLTESPLVPLDQVDVGSELE